MYGKLQKQQQDMQFYVAIRHVDASGTPLTVPELLVLQPLLRSNTLHLAGPTPSLPATVVQAMQAAADFGLGPEQGCAGVCVCAICVLIPTACRSNRKLFTAQSSACGVV